MADFIETLSANFVGRLCTILTKPVSFQFADAIQHSQFFTGKIEEINKDGIWLRHVHSKTVAFYTFPIIGIVEEQVISENDPRAEQLKAEFAKKEKAKQDAEKAKSPHHMKPPPPPQQQGQFIPIESLTKIVKDGQK